MKPLDKNIFLFIFTGAYRCIYYSIFCVFLGLYMSSIWNNNILLDKYFNGVIYYYFILWFYLVTVLSVFSSNAHLEIFSIERYFQREKELLYKSNNKFLLTNNKYKFLKSKKTRTNIYFYWQSAFEFLWLLQSRK